ncbi:MAG: HNH endonuclease, partial [Lachnospiraceae bacterium]|nr:HNH endonuclease [Lachnospiraceae bacterium]
MTSENTTELSQTKFVEAGSFEEYIEYETLKDYPNYEISTTFPFIVRNKTTKYVLKENIYNGSGGYPSITVDNKSIRKHILIARQFIQNDDPEHLTEIDHINHNRADYHLNNLRWVTRSDNQKNRISSTVGNITYEYVDKIPDDAIVVDKYNT